MRRAGELRSVSVVLALAAACAVGLWSSVFVEAQVQSPPGITPGTVGSGGGYRGPGDIIPPNFLPDFDPHTGCFDANGNLQNPCDACELPTDTCGTPCPLIGFQPIRSQCINCLEDEGGDECYVADSWVLRFGAARAFCNDPRAQTQCKDAAGNLTLGVAYEENVCEVHVFQTLVTNAEFDVKKPTCGATATQICLNGQAQLQPPHPLDEWHQGDLSCQGVDVSLTVGFDCFCESILRWEAALGGQASIFDNTIVYQVGFTQCESCTC